MSFKSVIDWTTQIAFRFYAYPFLMVGGMIWDGDVGTYLNRPGDVWCPLGG